MIKVRQIAGDRVVHLDTVENLELYNSGDLHLGIDCSSTCTGLCIATSQGVPLYTMAVERDKGDDYILYKVKLKKLLLDLFTRYNKINHVFYEEPFFGYAESSKILMTLRTTVQEIKYEYTPRFDYIAFKEISNQTWKRLFLSPARIPSGTPAQKAAVRKKLEEEYFSCFKELTQDEVDSTAMAIVCTMKILIGEEGSLDSVKKAHPFKYEVKFIGADTDDAMFEVFDELQPSWKIPKKLKKDAYKLVTLNGRGMFNNKVYDTMGDDDRVLILKYDSARYGNVTLEYQIGTIAASSKYLYAIVWRTRRKASK